MNIDYKKKYIKYKSKYLKLIKYNQKGSSEINELQKEIKDLEEKKEKFIEDNGGRKTISNDKFLFDLLIDFNKAIKNKNDLLKEKLKPSSAPAPAPTPAPAPIPGPTPGFTPGPSPRSSGFGSKSPSKGNWRDTAPAPSGFGSRSESTQDSMRSESIRSDLIKESGQSSPSNEIKRKEKEIVELEIEKQKKIQYYLEKGKTRRDVYSIDSEIYPELQENYINKINKLRNEIDELKKTSVSASGLVGDPKSSSSSSTSILQRAPAEKSCEEDTVGIEELFKEKCYMDKEKVTLIGQRNEEVQNKFYLFKSVYGEAMIRIRQVVPNILFNINSYLQQTYKRSRRNSPRSLPRKNWNTITTIKDKPYQDRYILDF